MTLHPQTVAGHPVAWVNNQFRQYVYDITDLIRSPEHGDRNITVSFESAYTYGLNVTSRPDVEWTINDDVRAIGAVTSHVFIVSSSSIQISDRLSGRFNLTLVGIGSVT